MADALQHPTVLFETHPTRYKHWRLEFPEAYAGKVARLVMDIPEDGGLRPGYPLKLNSYDLGVDLELADSLQRIRFEHPEVRAVEITSGKDRIFCSGANIYMLGSSTHAFKVNFCKFTNETRLYLEEMSAESGILSLAALNGTASGGGYELAIACDEIVLVDDGSSAVSLPEAPLLGVLPGTGGLTRLVDKRKIRRDLADVFSTVAEGVRGKRSVEWSIVDACPPKAKFEKEVETRLQAMVARSKRVAFPPVQLPPLSVTRSENGAEYKYVKVEIQRGARTASITMLAPKDDQPKTPAELAKMGANAWAIQAWRELDDALLNLRFNEPSIGTITMFTRGDKENVLAVDAMLAANRSDGLVKETLLLMKRVLKRLDMMAKSVFSIVDGDSCFFGSLFELTLAGDRTYMLDAAGVRVGLSELNREGLPMGNGLTRLASRFLREPNRIARVFELETEIDTETALKEGLVTFGPDDLDWDDEVRIAVEERASMSPDAMTGMEASLRYGGPETLETKIFGRLTAWQNWIFQRPNAVGPKGALTLYGRPERAEYDFNRT